MLRRFQDKSVQRSCFFQSREISFDQFCRGKVLLAQRVTRLRQREGDKIDHPDFGSSQKNGFGSAAEDVSFRTVATTFDCIGNGCTGNPANSASPAAGWSG